MRERLSALLVECPEHNRTDEHEQLLDSIMDEIAKEN